VALESLRDRNAVAEMRGWRWRSSNGRDDSNQTGAQPHLHSGKAQENREGLGLRKVNQVVERPDTPASAAW